MGIRTISVLQGLFRQSGGGDEADFVYIRKQTGATAGNLSVQLDKLSEAGYIAVEKGFKGKKPCTTCRVTEAGISAFSEYVAALMDYITWSPQLSCVFARTFCHRSIDFLPQTARWLSS